MASDARRKLTEGSSLVTGLLPKHTHTHTHPPLPSDGHQHKCNEDLTCVLTLHGFAKRTGRNFTSSIPTVRTTSEGSKRSKKSCKGPGGAWTAGHLPGDTTLALALAALAALGRGGRGVAGEDR